MVDLTPFDFTPTESHVYEVLITRGPGTGYAIARAAGLARANAYSALEGLVAKGAARAEPGRPRRYRPEAPQVLLGRVVDRQSQAIEALSRELERVTAPSSPPHTEVTSLRGAGQLLTLEIARAKERVGLCAPAESYRMVGPALRRAAQSGAKLTLWSDEVVPAEMAPVGMVASDGTWPGRPLLAVIDDRAGLIGSVSGDHVAGYWSGAGTLVAAAHHALQSLGGASSRLSTHDE
jgi:sugar-specific transcriptional regulator TrmB